MQGRIRSQPVEVLALLPDTVHERPFASSMAMRRALYISVGLNLCRLTCYIRIQESV